MTKTDTARPTVPSAPPRVSPGVGYAYQELARAVGEWPSVVVTGVMGDDTANLTTEIVNRGIPYFAARHEATAIAMADGIAWTTRAVAVSLVTRGPGLMNSVTALKTAANAGSGVLLITGEAPPGTRKELDRKWVDSRVLLAGIDVERVHVDSADALLPSLRSAYLKAAEGRPVALCIRTDVLNGPCDTLSWDPPVLPADPASRHRPVPGDVDALAAFVDSASRTLFLAGRGAYEAGARDAIERLALRTGGLLGTTLPAKDLFRGSPVDIGVVGAYSSETTRGLLGSVDSIVSFGASLNPDTTTTGRLFSRARVAQVDVDRSAFDRFTTTSLHVEGDAGIVADEVVARLRGTRGASDVAVMPPRFHEDLLEVVPLDPRDVGAVLDSVLPDDRVLVFDSGRFMRSTARTMRVSGPDAFRMTVDAGSIALGLGVAIGHCIARPDRSTVLIIGDGGLSMSLGDLETVVRYRLPLAIVVVNDQGYGSERVFLERDGMPTDEAYLDDMDFAGIARAIGFPSTRTIRTRAELERLGDMVSAVSTPTLADVKVSREVTVPLVVLD